jgi:hypothetical protein
MSSANEHRGISQEPRETAGVNVSAEEGRTVIKETYEDTRHVVNKHPLPTIVVEELNPY